MEEVLLTIGRCSARGTAPRDPKFPDYDRDIRPIFERVVGIDGKRPCFTRPWFFRNLVISLIFSMAQFRIRKCRRRATKATHFRACQKTYLPSTANRYESIV